MGQAVLHFEKYGKPTSGTLGNHIDRIEGKEYSYRHADLSMLDKNVSIKLNKYCEMDYNEAILSRIKDGYNARNKAGELKEIRKDAVYSVNAIFSGSHEDMKRIEKDPIQMDKWIEKNLEFAKKYFGAENITRFVCHRDEKSPHIHCTFVPITADGRLSANELIGNSLKLERFQTIYAEEMAEFGLERGIKSTREHHTTEEHRKRERYKLDDNKDILKDIDNLKQTDIFDFSAKKEILKAKIKNVIVGRTKEEEMRLNELKAQINQLEQSCIRLNFENNQNYRNFHYFNERKKEEIFNNFNLVDYFFHLVEKGELNFTKKIGSEFYFHDENKTKKISVKENGIMFFDHKSGIGGQKIKAVMDFSNLSWYRSMQFMEQFIGVDLSHIYNNIKEEIKLSSKETCHISAILRPNNYKLIEYFNKRGISPETLKNNAKQIHFQLEDRHSFGIGLQNILGGYDIRNSEGKLKLGKSSYSSIGNNHSNTLAVFEGLTDYLSFTQIVSDRIDEFRFIVLNSVHNVDKFINDFQDYNGIVMSILDSGKAGTEATKKICTYFGENSSDLRPNFNIGDDHDSHKDLNDYLLGITNLDIYRREEILKNNLRQNNERERERRWRR